MRISLSMQLALLGLTASLGWADATVDQKPLGPDGRLVGCAISRQGLHVAALAPKGSRYLVYIDGQPAR